MIGGVTGVSSNKSPVPSDIVHHVAYSNRVGYVRLCDAPSWFVEMYNARVLIEVDPIGRTMTISLTKDPVDCMSCLVAQARTC